jgi:hypothetical protein
MSGGRESGGGRYFLGEGCGELWLEDGEERGGNEKEVD